jgi:hypothetical protein
LPQASTGLLRLKLVTNRGVKVWPEGFPETFCTDHWRSRFVSPATEGAGPGTAYRPLALLAGLLAIGVLFTLAVRPLDRAEQ